ncbi:hypothetical protein A3SI_06739 [Nitritalea halalkaliphila LW7]|uniref:Polysaccharide deacetylase n=1 Tax=Nitritalea halalkaliphila LW7 TaxID=1189621 RepID=I5C611_9BACT|nr:hypothetical protein [Nitritalea halalkaliphila]EIM77263.1 hypothetical protein A3SI_06739 [Nitritalea halalkaliphila LW7]
MLLGNLKNAVRQTKAAIANIPGFRTNRKIIVFESDDWGTLRMRDKDAFKLLLTKGYPVDKCPYNRLDRLENNTDITMLAETLLKHRDSRGNPAKFTLNYISANPDFEKIRAADFTSFHFEPFLTTLKRYSDADKVEALVKEGIHNLVFQPQFHGREHVNVPLWLSRLQAKEKRFLDAFQQGMFTVAGNEVVSGRKDNLDTYGHVKTDTSLYDLEQSIREGQIIFCSTWGFHATTFIAPCYVWHPNLEPFLLKHGVKGIQGTHVQCVPLSSGFAIKRKYHFTGQKNTLGQTYLVRNVSFEPAERPQADQVDRVLKSIQNAFFWGKPAIISSHRLNFIGSLHKENREKNIEKLDMLLSQIRKRWPEVEFMSSDQLLSTISA